MTSAFSSIPHHVADLSPNRVQAMLGLRSRLGQQHVYNIIFALGARVGVFSDRHSPFPFNLFVVI